MTNENEFNPGDIVYLKSGSPPLVIEAIRSHLIVIVWYGDYEVMRETVPLWCLTHKAPSFLIYTDGVDLRDIPHGGSA